MTDGELRGPLYYFRRMLVDMACAKCGVRILRHDLAACRHGKPTAKVLCGACFDKGKWYVAPRKKGRESANPI